MTKNDLFEAGALLVSAWCSLNSVKEPSIEWHTGKPTFGVCAYYRSGVIHIWVDSCAAVGTTGRLWSYPGYCVDRTPYGVLAHELGHHVDGQHGPLGGVRSHEWRAKHWTKPLTSYCPNDNEWFAEWFRLFVTNPTLMADIAPRLFEAYATEWSEFAERRHWRDVLAASSRHLAVAAKRAKAKA